MNHSTTKSCTGCHKTFPATTEYFHRHKRGHYGLRAQCKTCCNAYNNSYRTSARGKIITKTANLRWNASERGKSYRLKYNQHYRQTEVGKRAARQSAKKMKQKYPAKVKAISDLNHAVRDGKIPPIKTQRCKVCERQAEHYHHEDYSKPYAVIPLCLTCHQKHHQGIISFSDTNSSHNG